MHAGDGTGAGPRDQPRRDGRYAASKVNDKYLRDAAKKAKLVEVRRIARSAVDKLARALALIKTQAARMALGKVEAAAARAGKDERRATADAASARSKVYELADATLHELGEQSDDLNADGLLFNIAQAIIDGSLDPDLRLVLLRALLLRARYRRAVERVGAAHHLP
jgi:hypothetical protein